MWGVGQRSNLTPDDVKALVSTTYRNPAATLAQLEEVKAKHKTVLVKTEVIKAANQHSIVNLAGTFPITFKGVTYNLPLHARVLPDFPASAPVVFLVPTADMAIVRQHKNVDESGRCYFPYLSAWNPVNSTLAGLVLVMSEAFSESPPLFSKPKPLAHVPPVDEKVVRPSFQAPLPAAAASAAAAYVTNHEQHHQKESPVVEAEKKKKAAVDEDEVDPKMCIVCFERPKEAMTTPCNHVACCMTCAEMMHKQDQPCPVCRVKIASLVRIYIV